MKTEIAVTVFLILLIGFIQVARTPEEETISISLFSTKIGGISSALFERAVNNPPVPANQNFYDLYLKILFKADARSRVNALQSRLKKACPPDNDECTLNFTPSVIHFPTYVPYSHHFRAYPSSLTFYPLISFGSGERTEEDDVMAQEAVPLSYIFRTPYFGAALFGANNTEFRNNLGLAYKQSFERMNLPLQMKNGILVFALYPELGKGFLLSPEKVNTISIDGTSASFESYESLVVFDVPKLLYGKHRAMIGLNQVQQFEFIINPISPKVEQLIINEKTVEIKFKNLLQEPTTIKSLTISSIGQACTSGNSVELQSSGIADVILNCASSLSAPRIMMAKMEFSLTDDDYIVTSPIILTRIAK